MVKVAEPKSPVKEAAAKVGATAPPPAAKQPMTDDERSLEHLRLIKELGVEIRARKRELGTARQVADSKKAIVKGLEAELEELETELDELIEDPFKKLPLLAPKKEATAAAPQMFIGKVSDVNGKLLGTYAIKALSPGAAHQALKDKHATGTATDVKAMTREHEFLKLELIDATIDPSWRKRRVEELKLAGPIAANLDTSILTAEHLVSACVGGKLSDKEHIEVLGALDRFKAGLTTAQNADYTAFVTSIPTLTQAGDKPAADPTTTTADATPVKRGRASKKDREIAGAVAETEASATTTETGAEMVRRKWDESSPEARVDMMAKALTEQGGEYWGECQVGNLDLSDEIKGKLAAAGFDSIGALVAECQDGRFLDRIQGINKAKAALISEALRNEWEATLKEDPEWALPAASPELHRTAS